MQEQQNSTEMDIRVSGRLSGAVDDYAGLGGRSFITGALHMKAK